MKIKSKLSVRNISITAMLIALGVVISAISPLRIIIEPASHSNVYCFIHFSDVCSSGGTRDNNWLFG